jgi:hypothetical protein
MSCHLSCVYIVQNTKLNYCTEYTCIRCNILTFKNIYLTERVHYYIHIAATDYNKNTTHFANANMCARLQFVGVWLTVRYRNQKDPRANPSAFL